MLALALRSVRHRPGRFAATLLVLTLGAAIVTAFASLLDTAGHPAATAADEETLGTMASVAGGWCLLIVAFAATSTVAQALRQREQEVALLRSVGATPRQLTRMVAGEALTVALAASVAALPAGLLGGRALLAALQDAGQVSAAVEPRFGAAALTLGLAVPLLAAAAAALLGARKTVRAAHARAPHPGDQPAPLGRARTLAAIAFLVAGVGCGTVTATVFDGKGIDAQQTAGQASIWASLGLALLARALVTRVGTGLARTLGRHQGAAGFLTAANVRARSREMAGALMPIVVFTGIAAGCVAMQTIENGAPPAAPTATTAAEAEQIGTLNFVVVGMLALFAGIVLVNTLVAATADRRRELGQQRLIGATPREVVRMVGLEGVVLGATGVAFGTLASLATVVPYALARLDGPPPASTALVYAAVIAGAAGLTVASLVGAARRAVAAPAVAAVSGG